MRCADAEPVLIFDLDETVLLVNSFPLWLRLLLYGRLPGLAWKQRLRLAYRAAALAVQRKLGVLDHDLLLHRLRRAWRDAAGERSDALLCGFQAALLRHVRPSLRPVLELVASGRHDGILATAAASDYADGLARRLGFRHALTTSGHLGQPARRNAGIAKRDAVLAWLAGQGWHTRPRVLFTDHADDLPLIHECDVVFWFGHDAACPHLAGSGIRLLPCANLGPEALLLSLRESFTR